jgi:hypothetical protein
LGFRAAELLERGADLFGFHALRADRNVERVAERGDRVDDLRGALALHDRRDEALVDLDAVERQPVDLGEACVAGAEIVERDAHADILEALDDGQHLLAVLEQRAFGDLDLEPVGGKAGRRQLLEDLLGEQRIAELDGRDVDRELEVLRPLTGFPHRLLDHAHRQRNDQARALGGFDELLGVHHRTVGRAPAGKRLEADDLLGRQIDQRLEVGDEVAIADARADALLQLEPIGELQLQLLVEPGEGVATGALGGIKRDVAAAQRPFLIVARLEAGEADRGGGLELRAFGEDRRGEALLNGARD